jgi:hypothetical protein
MGKRSAQPSDERPTITLTASRQPCRLHSTASCVAPPCSHLCLRSVLSVLTQPPRPQSTPLRSGTLDFSSLKGKVVLIVNVASQCGKTPQYKQLQQLHERYESDGLVIIGFPSNQFKQQEPGESDGSEGRRPASAVAAAAAIAGRPCSARCPSTTATAPSHFLTDGLPTVQETTTRSPPSARPPMASPSRSPASRTSTGPRPMPSGSTPRPSSTPATSTGTLPRRCSRGTARRSSTSLPGRHLSCVGHFCLSPKRRIHLTFDSLAGAGRPRARDQEAALSLCLPNATLYLTSMTNGRHRPSEMRGEGADRGLGGIQRDDGLS